LDTSATEPTFERDALSVEGIGIPLADLFDSLGTIPSDQGLESGG
jgi:hypothetical protein